MTPQYEQSRYTNPYFRIRTYSCWRVSPSILAVFDLLNRVV